MTNERLFKANYGSLSPRQKAFIDAIAFIELQTGSSPDDEDNPDYRTTSWTFSDVKEAMEEEFDQDPYNAEGGTSQALKKRRDLIEERKIHLSNERKEFNGRVRTEAGNAAYEGPAEGINAMMQHISERPVQSIEKTEDDDIELTITISQEKLFALLRDSDEETAREIFETIVG